jgi:aminoglycoside phosphotransferase (APT) family kinase protein
MRHLAELHRLTPETIALPDLAMPSTAAGLALDQLLPIETRYRGTPSAQHPLVDFGLGWLRSNAPRDIVRISLVHGDAGPGNLI